MHAFICWSGPRSRQLADKLSSWLPTVCGPGLSCGISTEFDAAALWFQELTRQLEACDVAVICFTAENLPSAWLHFEAGMVFRAKAVVPYYLGTEVPEIKGPLNAIQAKAATREGTQQMVDKLAQIGKLESAGVQRLFDEHWPDLDRFIRSVAAPKFVQLFPDFEALFERKTFGEPIDECTDQGWVARYDGARDTLLTIERRVEVVERCCQPWQTWLYRKLHSQLDGYVRDLRENLLLGRRFAVDDAGKVDFGRPDRLPALRSAGAIATTCRRRCAEIGHVVFCLTKPQGAPQLDDALRFAKLGIGQFDDKKRLVQSKGTPVDRAALGIAPAEELERCADSFWDFDRIIYYRVLHDEPIEADRIGALVEKEQHQAEADGPGASKMPLHYAVKAWLSALERRPTQAFDAAQAARRIDGALRFLDRSAKPGDNDPKLRALLAEIAALVQSRRGPAGPGAA